MKRSPGRHSLRFRILAVALLIGPVCFFDSCRSQPASTGALPENWGVRKAVPFETVKKDFADPEKTDNGHYEIEALHHIRKAEGKTQLTSDDVEAYRSQDKAEENRHQGLERVTPSQPDET